VKRLLFFVGGGLAVASACAQQAPATVHPSGPSMEFVETPEAHEQRLAILTNEREDTKKKLATAVIALQKTPDNKESIDDVTRLQADLQALEREIARVESRRSGAAPANRKPAASAGGDLSHEAKPDNQAYESWDVFKNFPKKVNTQ
jgi:hypothetical protein